MPDDFRSDPVLRLLPEEVPASYHAMPREEQAWRGRYFLMTWVLFNQDMTFAWWAALNDEPQHVRDAKEAVRNAHDQQIIEAVQIANEVLAERAAERVSVQ
jgi:hypothetical protein